MSKKMKPKNPVYRSGMTKEEKGRFKENKLVRAAGDIRYVIGYLPKYEAPLALSRHDVTEICTDIIADSLLIYTQYTALKDCVKSSLLAYGNGFSGYQTAIWVMGFATGVHDDLIEGMKKIYLNDLKCLEFSPICKVASNIYTQWVGLAESCAILNSENDKEITLLAGGRKNN